MHRSQMVILPADLSAARAHLSFARLFADSANSALEAMCSNNERLECRVSKLSATLDLMRLQFAAAQSSISPAAFESLRSKRVQYFGLQRALINKFNCLNNGLTNLLATPRDNRSNFCRCASLFSDWFLVLVDENGVPAGALVALSTDLSLVVFNQYCSFGHFIGCCPSLSFLAGFWTSKYIF